MTRISWAGLALGLLITLAPARPLDLMAQEVIPGGRETRVTADLSPNHWAAGALRRAEGLGLLSRPLPPHGSLSLEHVREGLAEAREMGAERGGGVARMTEGWYSRFQREFGGLAVGYDPAIPVSVIGARVAAEGWVGNDLAAPGYGEVGDVRTGALPVEDPSGIAVVGDVTGSFGDWAGYQAELSLGTDALKVRRAEVAAGVGNWKASVGRQPVRFAGSRATGMVMSGSTPINRLQVRTARPAELPGFLEILGPVSLQLFAGALWNDERHEREPYLWGGSFSIQPFPRIRLAAHRAAMFGGRGYDEPVTVRTFVDMLLGRVKNLGFENQIVSVEGWFRLPTEELVPLTAYFEWGAEDAAGAWWDVPGRVFGLETPAVPGLEALSVGAAYTQMPEHCCGNPPWYRHGAFEGNWASGDLPLGLPLGGEGWEWRAYGGWDRLDAGYRIEADLIHRKRDGQNLYFPGRDESSGIEVRASWWERPGVEVVGEARLERGSEWTEQWLGLSANLYF